MPTICQMPCALRNHLLIETNLSQPECDIIFQHWVTTERNFLPSLSPAERLTCPVLWCGISFVDHDSLLRHLKDCPQLSASCYWCPRCHRAESFASNKIPDPIPSSDNQSPVQKKPSRLRKLLSKPFSRKRATDPRQDTTIKPNSFPQELHNNHKREMDGQGLHGELVGDDPMWYSPSEMDASETLQKQSVPFCGPYTHNLNSEPIEKDSCHGIFEKDGNGITCEERPSRSPSYFSGTGTELPVQSQQPDASVEKDLADFGANESSYAPMSSPFPAQVYIGDHVPNNTSTQFIQSNRPSRLSNPVPNYINPDYEAVFEQTKAPSAGGYGDVYHPCYGTEKVYFSELDHPSSQFNDLNSASGMFDHQYPQLAGGQVSRRPGNFDHAQRSTPSRNGSPHAPNLAEGQLDQIPSRPPSNFDHAPRSTPSGNGSTHTQNPVHNCKKPTMDLQLSVSTMNVHLEQIARHRHPIPETGSQNSPSSASSNQTNTTWPSESMGTPLTPATPFLRGSGSTPSGNGSPYAPNLAEGTIPWKYPAHSVQALMSTPFGYDSPHTPYSAEGWIPSHPPSNFNHSPRSAPSGNGSTHTQNPVHNCKKPTMDPQLSVNKMNVITEYSEQIARQRHPNPETGSQTSPSSASSNQTNTTWSSESTGTPLTPATPFSRGSGPPISTLPLNTSNSPAGSSGSPPKKGFTCKTCGTLISDRSNLKRHEKSKHGKVVYFCRAGCGGKFVRQDHEVRHWNKKIQNELAEDDTKLHLDYARKFNMPEIFTCEAMGLDS